MDETLNMVNAVTEIGLPALICIVMMVAVFRYLPAYIKHRQQLEKDQREYYNQRQKAYDEQMKVIISVAEQGNLMIGAAKHAIEQSSEVIRMNTDTIKQNMAAQEKVLEAIGRDIDSTRGLEASFEKHDRRAEKMNTDIVKLLERAAR
jgi:hypothetical protein